jgi:hypothetical protein
MKPERFCAAQLIQGMAGDDYRPCCGQQDRCREQVQITPDGLSGAHAEGALDRIAGGITATRSMP